MERLRPSLHLEKLRIQSSVGLGKIQAILYLTAHADQGGGLDSLAPSRPIGAWTPTWSEFLHLCTRADADPSDRRFLHTTWLGNILVRAAWRAIDAKSVRIALLALFLLSLTRELVQSCRDSTWTSSNA